MYQYGAKGCLEFRRFWLNKMLFFVVFVSFTDNTQGGGSVKASGHFAKIP
jgi:hypothetical protein